MKKGLIISSMIAVMFSSIVSTKANAANCNIFYDWKKCNCAVTDNAGNILKTYSISIGGWASCRIEGCTPGNAGTVADAQHDVTLGEECISKA